MSKTLFSLPRLHRAAHGEERKVTWLELFYDLVYVAVLIQLGNVLSEQISLEGFGRFVILFLPLWWAWTGMTFYMNRFVVNDLPHRLLIYLQITAIAVLGISLEGAFTGLTQQFSLAYAAIRLVQVLLYVRTWKHEPATRPLTQRYVTGYLVGIALWVVAGFLPMPYAAGLWLLALAIEIGNAFLPGTRALVSLLPPDAEHMRERYGIFIIIVLGESFIKTITNASGTAISLEILVFSLLAIFVVFGLWWLYFDDVEAAEIKHRLFAPYVWIYAHLPLSLGITAFGVASKKIFASAGEDHLKSGYVVLYCGALILFALASAALELALEQEHERKKDWRRAGWRLGMAAAMAGLMLFGASLGALGFIAVVAAIVLVVVALDEWPHIQEPR
ncbi:MAG: low temperature requirement protein A [Chloroflexota bacterium]